MSPLTLVRGDSPQQGNFVCTGCGGRYPTREALGDHWAQDATCRAVLSRPIGTYGAPGGGKHCLGCHDRAGACPSHGHGGCPAC